ncbi:hypothetical protein [Chryseosolibacter indicus]|uniref:HTH arsR-type domain-containing protein n=1 Tax=Chryseosolibacter indicus TaxID=2782351 RepID=A0ABS5VLK0_9BACT|nr:hypothetical protein [Chryseosolibacter indicus]MBT1702317.1 hypothetical protein [Chryseosolibacter indicus]
MKKSLTQIDLTVLDTLKRLGRKSAFEVAALLSDQYDTLSVLRSLHHLLDRDLLVRYNIYGDRYYQLNFRNEEKIKRILDQKEANPKAA